MEVTRVDNAMLCFLYTAYVANVECLAITSVLTNLRCSIMLKLISSYFLVIIYMMLIVRLEVTGAVCIYFCGRFVMENLSCNVTLLINVFSCNFLSDNQQKEIINMHLISIRQTII